MSEPSSHLAPHSDIDLFSDDAIRYPYDLYKELRAAGPVVWMTKYDVWAVPRYADVKTVLRDHRTFSSANGVSIDEEINKATSQTYPNSLTSDPPLHDDIRRITGAPLSPRALKEIAPVLAAEAEKLIRNLCARDSFDGMVELAHVLPLTVVSELVGLPAYGKENMLKWAAASFNVIGPMNERGRAALGELKEFHQFCREEAVPGKLRPDGWAQRLYDAATRGEISADRCPGMMREYIAPSLDTTIFATGHLLRLLGENPDQWELLKADRSLIPAAINETLRMEAPIRSFGRWVTKDCELDGVKVPESSRVLVLYASANRDERKWENPDAFDITRRANDHVGFGHGIHACAGMHLARMEMTALLEQMIERVDKISVGKPTMAMNNLLNGYAHLPVTFS